MRRDHSSSSQSLPAVNRNRSAHRAFPVRSYRNRAASNVPGEPNISSRAGWSMLPAISASSAASVASARRFGERHHVDRRLAHQVGRMLASADGAVPGSIEREQAIAIEGHGGSRCDRADRVQIAEGPDDTGGAAVERRLDRMAPVAIERMRRPATLRIESPDGVADDASYRGADPGLVPGQGGERFVAIGLVQHESCHSCGSGALSAGADRARRAGRRRAG